MGKKIEGNTTVEAIEKMETALATVSGEKEAAISALDKANHQIAALACELDIHESATASNMLMNNSSVFTGTKWATGHYGNDMHVDEKGNVSALVTVKNNDGKGDIVKDVTFSKVDAPKAVALNALTVAKELGTVATCYYLSSFGDNCKKYGYTSIGDFGARFCGIQAGTARQYYRIGKFYEGVWDETPSLKLVYPCDSKVDRDEDGNILSIDSTSSCLYNVSVGNILQVLSIIESCEGKDPTEKLAAFKEKYLTPDDETGEPLIYLSMPTSMLKEDLKKKGLVDTSKGRKSSKDDKESKDSEPKSSNASNKPKDDEKESAPIEVVKRAHDALVSVFDTFSDRYGEKESDLLLEICTALEKLVSSTEVQESAEATESTES